nr:SDR family oxidoreductase [Candidatus Paracaedibacter acanthamoebae]
MTKAAVDGLTRGLARELGPRGITINNVRPGPIDTDMNPANSEQGKMLASTVAVGRYGKGEEIASLVAFLASPEAAYITGTGLLADGGFSA